MTDHQYASMRQQIAALHPELSAAAITYACNKIGNELHSMLHDINEVNLSATPFEDEPGYFSFFSVTVRGKRIFVRARKAP